MPQNCSQEAASRLAEIDALQDEVLRQLDELERRTEAVLAACGAAPPQSPANHFAQTCKPGQLHAA